MNMKRLLIKPINYSFASDSYFYEESKQDINSHKLHLMYL